MAGVSVKTDELSVIADIKKDILTHFQQIPDGISMDDFDLIWSILKEKLDKEVLTKDFKSELRSQLERDFNRMWHSSDCETSLSIIALLKEKFRNDPKPKWRPTNQPVAAQVMPLDIQLLHHKKKFLKDSIEREKLEISNLMEKLDEYRKHCKQVNYSRDQVVKEMEEQITIYKGYVETANKFDAPAYHMLND